MIKQSKSTEETDRRRNDDSIMTDQRPGETRDRAREAGRRGREDVPLAAMILTGWLFAGGFVVSHELLRVGNYPMGALVALLMVFALLWAGREWE